MSVKAKAYTSPTLVLLALDWPEGANRPDFLGFAIKRTPGFLASDGQSREAHSWLPNRVTFGGPVPEGTPEVASNIAPIQKFLWWDARIEPADRNASFTYAIWPVLGEPGNLTPIDETSPAAELVVALPDHMVDGVGTWFNRAVLSSQGFERKLRAMGLGKNQKPTDAQALVLRQWLANDLEQVFGIVLAGASRASSAVYHLTDELWAIPQLKSFAAADGRRVAVVYDSHKVLVKGKPPKDSPNVLAISKLSPPVNFYPRDKTAIMHNKFIVTDGPNAAGKPMRLLDGSANFTTEGLTQQANLLHIFDSPELAEIYDSRARSLSGNPDKAATAKFATAKGLAQGWSKQVTVGATKVRVFFSPEPTKSRVQTDTVVDAVKAAKSSVLFCIFTPTDKKLRDACFDAGDKGLMMFGVVNNISEKSAKEADEAKAENKDVTGQSLANLELYHRSRDNRDVIDGSFFSPETVPEGFEAEHHFFPGEGAPSYAPVVIHHKFVVIDAETDDPIVFSGSANMSENSEHNNDENLMEIKDPRIARIYLAEFMRLYEHYRARAIVIKEKKATLSGKPPKRQRLALQPDAAWAKKYYLDGSPECKARKAMAA